MAVDTQNKRRSVIFILPVPDNSIDQADRQQVARIYSGVLAANIIISLDSGVFNVPAEDRVYEVLPTQRVYNVPAEDRVYEVLP